MKRKISKIWKILKRRSQCIIDASTGCGICTTIVAIIMNMYDYWEMNFIHGLVFAGATGIFVSITFIICDS